MDNLSLKKDALEELHLPITVTRGFVGKIHVTIPWTALDSKPLQVMIENVYLQASPLDISSLNSEKIREEVRLTKHKRLEDVEAEIIKSFSDKPGEEGLLESTNKSFIESLTEKIVDNLEVSIRKVHIRFEDSISVPGKVFAAGITLDSFRLMTTNSMWKEAFISRQDTQEAIHKLAVMRSFAVYWCTDSQSFADLGGEEWDRSMESLVFTGGGEIGQDNQVILKYYSSI